jgi:hypothetical protein
MAQARKEQFEDLSQVFYHVSSVNAGRDLLVLAARTNCEISYDHSLPPNIHGKKSLEYVDVVTLKPRIVLNPQFVMEEQVKTLCHELRHLWQYFQIKPLSHALHKMSPLFYLGLTRVIEGDAYAFQANICRQIKEATGLKIPLRSSEMRLSWKELFEDFQCNGSGARYDQSVLEQYKDIALKMNKGVLGKVFNICSLDTMGDLLRVTRAGLGADAPCYVDYADSRSMLFSVLERVDPLIKAQTRALTF